MSQDARKQEYLARAKEAEEQAAKVKDENSKSAWLRIAAGYRDLVNSQKGKL